MYQLLPVAMSAALLTNPVAVVTERPASCAADQTARVVRSVRPEYPAIARERNLEGTSVIRVDLSDTGSVVGAYVVVSSGSSLLDQAAIRTAKSMVFAPETKSCKPTAGSYAVEVEYAA